MKSKLITLVFVISSSFLFSQVDSTSFQRDIKSLNSRINYYEKEIEGLQHTISNQASILDSISNFLNSEKNLNEILIQENKDLKGAHNSLKNQYQNLSNDFLTYKKSDF